MLDFNIKKIVIENKNLPDLSPINQGYLFRYRIVSEDKNRLSHWSPIFLIKPEYDFDKGVLAFSSSQNIGNFVWDPVIIKKNNNIVRIANEFDIWVKYDRNDGGDWIYKQRVNSNNYSTPHPSTYTINGIIQPSSPNKVSIEVYLKGNPISRDYSFLKIYEMLNHAL
jgi:hypothetical protein